MQISAFRTFRYQLPLAKELRVRGQDLKAREGAIVQITDDGGRSGFGEVAPLAGVSLETLPQAAAQLNRLRKAMLGTTAPHDFAELETRMKRDEEVLFPSVRCGLEMAFWSLWAARRKESPAAFLNPSAASIVPVNGLLVGDLDLAAETQELLRQGFRALKLKAAGPVEQDIIRAQRVLDLCLESATLRVDANQSWNLEEALRFGEAQGMTMVEYIEEPFADIEQVPEFYDRTLIPVAVDESLRRHDLQKLKSIDGVEVVVLKPTALGLKRTIELADAARQYGLRPVISSAFESSVGVALLTHLAAALSRNVAAGLDTLKYFSTDLIQPAPMIEHGALSPVDPLQIERQIRLDLLEEWT